MLVAPQYASAVAGRANVSTLFDVTEDDFVLEWAQRVVLNMSAAPDGDWPLVWSISYGFPEVRARARRTRAPQAARTVTGRDRLGVRGGVAGGRLFTLCAVRRLLTTAWVVRRR